MVKLHLFSGFENRRLGISSDMEQGHLYSDAGDYIELREAAVFRLGLKEEYMHNPGFAHFDLWGGPLKRAKRLFSVVNDLQLAEDMKALAVDRGK